MLSGEVLPGCRKPENWSGEAEAAWAPGLHNVPQRPSHRVFLRCELGLGMFDGVSLTWWADTGLDFTENHRKADDSVKRKPS